MEEKSHGNTVGSLTSMQHAILVGSLLGDGTLRKQGTRTNALFEVNHCFEAKAYVDWKYSFFRAFVRTPPKSRKGNGRRVAYRFTTRSLTVFTEMFMRFYEGTTKVIPHDLDLNPVTLAVWFMDDGSRNRNSFYLNTQQFCMKDQILLQERLHVEYGIDSTLNRDKHYWRIRIRTDSAERLRSYVRPFLHEYFQYKLML